MFFAGDFTLRDAAARSILDLKANGFKMDEIAVFSDEPVEFPRGVLDRPSHMSFVVVLGAIVISLLVIGFVAFTQYNYPLVTGGMPIFSFWATGVVFYELTMLGSILVTFCWFLHESGLLRRGHRAAAPSVEPGVICVRVECTPERADAAKRSLESGGAGNIRTIGDRR
ncbi:MAG: quinol:electron acceptor oxidoreductase subunit ActD [Bryobacteraceae bacterium]